MNSFTMMSDSYKSLVKQGKVTQEEANPEIRIFDFLATCSENDFCRLVDSGAFNDIIKAYIELAVKSADIDEEARKTVMTHIYYVLDMNSAKEALAKYYGKE